jgi:UDP:flavonoid glycosyltransferase YjiC (YdhE family)
VRVRELGAEVQVCAPPDWAERLTQFGVSLVPLGPPVRELMRGTTPPSAADVPRRIGELIAEQFARLPAVAEGCDAMVATGLFPVTASVQSVAEKLGIRYVFAAYCPIYLPSPHHRPQPLPGRSVPPDVTDHRVLNDLDIQNYNTLYGGPLNAHRKSIGLPPVDNVRDHVYTDHPLLAADPVLSPWQETADLDVVQTGAWILPDERPLPAELEAFLDAGTPPVYVGFGSMRAPTDIARVAIDAIRAQGRRALVARGWADLVPIDDRADCFAVAEVNHHALFRRVAAVVHHGGAGTTTTAARAGAPQVVVPQMADQPYWAGRVADLGIGTAHDGPTPTTESLSAALSTALTPETRARAAAVAGTIRTDGATVAARLLLDAVSRERTPVQACTTRDGDDDMNPLTTSAFDLPDHLSLKADPRLIASDEQHFAAIAENLEQSIADLSDRLDAERKAPGGIGQEAMDRDMEIHRLTARLRALRRFGLDLCLGHMVSADNSEPVYIGRFGLTDGAGRRLLVDWRSPTAEPFFGATHANPMGLASRRRYRWTRGRITDYWDEVFTPDGFEGRAAALDDQSAFIASLGSSRSARMRDVLGTIQADQDAIIRAGSAGALVVDGGPGTGKTVVALHRTAYLLYADPRLGHRRGGVLFVGPHQPYLAYVADVLPSLGEEGVQSCTLRDLVAEGATAAVETDPEVARLKSSANLVKAIEMAVRFYEEPPAKPMTVATDESDIWLSADDWAEAFEAPDPGTPHNEARDQIWEELLTILMDKYDGDEAADLLRRSLLRNRELVTTFNRAWPLLEAADLVSDLWSVPAYLRKCAPWLSTENVRKLQRADAQAWTVSDLPLLDAARQRLGDPEASRRKRRHDAAVAAERARMTRVVDDLIEAADDEYGVGLVTMLRGEDFQDVLVDDSALPSADPDRLASPFAHIVVDEAQELTDAEWQMLVLRCPSRSFTIVGDRAQARHGFTESWQERLGRIGLDRINLASLSINYRTPEEVMSEAEPVIRAVLPDANVPTSIRSTDVPVVHGSALDLSSILDTWLAAHADGIACVIGDPTFRATSRVRSLTPELSKGLEFDLVVLIDPEAFGTGIEGAVDRYVAMTRATQQLVILTNS